MRFGDLDFIVTIEIELARVPIVVQPFHPAGLDAITKMLEELRLIGREPFSPEYIIWSAPMVLPFSLCNAAKSVGHLVAQRMTHTLWTMSSWG